MNCPECRGTGEEFPGNPRTNKCDRCGGSGKLHSLAIKQLRKAFDDVSRLVESLMPPPTHEGSCYPDAGCDGNCMDRATIGSTVQKLSNAIHQLENHLEVDPVTMAKLEWMGRHWVKVNGTPDLPAQGALVRLVDLEWASVLRSYQHAMDKMPSIADIQAIQAQVHRQMLKKETLCLHCGQPMLPPGEVKRPNEYDHARGCPADTPAKASKKTTKSRAK